MDSETNRKNVLGLVKLNGNAFYCTDVVGLSDEEGNPIEGVGLMISSVVPSIPSEMEGCVDIYDVPTFVSLETAKVMFLNCPKCPKTIEVLRRFTWEDIDVETGIPEETEDGN